MRKSRGCLQSLSLHVAILEMRSKENFVSGVLLNHTIIDIAHADATKPTPIL